MFLLANVFKDYNERHGNVSDITNNFTVGCLLIWDSFTIVLDIELLFNNVIRFWNIYLYVSTKARQTWLLEFYFVSSPDHNCFLWEKQIAIFVVANVFKD